MAEDNILTEFEKLQCLREWDAAKAECTSLVASVANIPNVSSTALSDAFNILSNYLNDKSKNNTTAFTGTAPALLITSGNTEIEGSVFKQYWRDYYNARSSLLASSSSSKVSVFVQSSRPTPPYKAGDLWIQTNNDNNMMICIVSRNAGATGYDSDWADLGDLTEKRDPRILIAALVNMVYTYNGGYIREKGNNAYEMIYLGAMPSAGHAQGDLAYANGNVYQYTDAWENISNETLRMSFKALYEIIGNYNIRIFRTRPTSVTPKLYDIVCSPLTFTDTNLPTTSPYRTIEGGIQIQMYNGTDWEILQESTHSLIENLSGYVRALAMKSAGDYSTAAGFITAGDWADLFAEAKDADGNKIAQAHLSAYVQKDSNGNIVSGVKIGADQIIVEGKTFTIGAEHIEFKGKTVINGKFSVDSNGNVTMDGFTATNATITGKVTASEGKIGGFTLSGNGLTNIVSDSDISSSYNMGYIICRNDYHSRFAGIGANVLPASSGASAVARFENEDDTELWFGTNIAAIISAKNAFTDNIALSILGGNVQGLALKTQIVGLDTISQSTEPSSSDKNVTIGRNVEVVYASTQWYWNNTSKSPAEKNTKTRNVNLTFPTMQHEDDGHMIWVKRGSNDNNTLKILAGGSYHKEWNSSTQRYEKKYYPTYLVTENDTEETSTTKLDREGCAALYVYFRDLTVTMNNTTYKGAWMEFRNPRYW